MELPEWYDPRFDPYCLEIGRLSTLWSMMESNVDQLIWELLDVPASKGICLTSQMIGPGPRMRALLSLVTSMGISKELSGDFQRFGNKLKTLGAKRNRYSHDHFTLGLQTGKVYQNEFTADHALRINRKELKVDDVKQLWIDFKAASETLRHLRFRLIEELPSWPRKRFLQSLSSPPPDTPGPDSNPLTYARPRQPSGP